MKNRCVHTGNEVFLSKQNFIHNLLYNLTKMVSYSVEKRSEMIGAIKAGATFSDVAQRYRCQKRTVIKTWNRYQTTGSVKDKTRPGRPKILTARTERRMVRKHKSNPFLTAPESGDQWNVSRHTVYRILKKYGLKCQKPVKVPIISAKNKKMRRFFSEKTRSWDHQWRQMLWSDESRFCLHQNDGTVNIYRQKNTRYEKRNQLHFNRWKTGGVMVWAGISYNYRTNLVFIDGNLNAERYINEILTTEVVPFLQAYPKVLYFQQDNSAPHSAAIT